MKEFLDLLKHTDKFIDWIIAHGGFYLLLFIIFAETGLFAGFFLPGDSLLFVAGIYIQKFCDSFFGVHWIIIMTLIALVAILGNLVGYWFGKKSGPLLYKRNDSFLFKKKYLVVAEKFLEKNGTMAIIAGRFVPIVRTFAPIVAGIVKSDHKKFVRDSVIGAFAWVFSMMLGGKFIHGLVLEMTGVDLTKHIELVALTIIFFTTAPVIYKFVRESRKASKEEKAAE
jgi:membrane-associated protein